MILTKVKNTEDTGSIPASANAGIILSYHRALVTVAKSLLPRKKGVYVPPKMRGLKESKESTNWEGTC